MTAQHNRKDNEAAPDGALRIVGYVRWGLLIFVALVFAFGALLWFGRKTVAQAALTNWCSQRDLVCEARFDSLGPDGATLSSVKVLSGDAVPFEAENVRADVDWPRMLTPKVTAVEVSSPTLRGTLTSEKLAFYGLEALAKPSGGSNTAPPVAIRDGRVFLMTEVGEIAATVTMDGAFPRDGVVRALIDPAALTGPAGALTWSEGVIDLTADQGRITGHVQVDLAKVELEGIRLGQTRLDANLGAPQSGDGDTRIDWAGEIKTGSFRGTSVEALVIAGSARLDAFPDLSVNEAVAALNELDFDIETGAVRYGDYAAEAVSLEGKLIGNGGGVTGPVGMDAADILSPKGRIRTMSAVGEAAWSPKDRVSFSGKLALDEIGLTPTAARQLSAPIRFPGVLSAHGDAARQAMIRAAARFNAASEIRLRQTETGISFDAGRASLVTAATGLRASIKPKANASWLSYADGTVSLRGDIAVEGGGAPTAFLSLNDFTRTAEGFSLDLGSISLKPWSVAGRTLAMNLAELSLTQRPEMLDLTTNGSVSLAGKVTGLDLETTRISGAITATRSGDKWQVGTLGKKCLGLSTEGFGFGGIAVEPTRANICPQNGAFIRQGRGAPTGSVSLGQITLPFTTKSGAGSLTLQNAAIDWSAQQGLSMTVLADTLSLPLSIGKSTLTIDGASPRLGLGTGQGAPVITARLGETTFGGTSIPANLSSSEFSFDGRSGEDSLSGTLSIPALQISDQRDDPLYQPLIAEITAKLDDGQMNFTGPLRLQRGGITIADIAAGLDIARLNGAARITLRPLTFSPGGLQPAMLSDRLRGVFTDAEGGLSGHALVNIQGGKLAGTGQAVVTDLSFQTQRLGRVETVNTDLTFTNLFKLTSARGQVMTIGGLNAGIPLRNGRIQYYLVEGKFLGIETATFPLAGGWIALGALQDSKDPLGWTLGGARQAFEVAVTDIELERLVEVLKLPDTRATGTVSGRFPIVFEDNTVKIEDALLTANSRGGTLSYTGDALSSEVVEDGSAKLAFAALKDLKFKVLELSLNGDLADRMQAGARIVGSNVNPLIVNKNTTLSPGQAFEFNINLDSQLAQLLNSGQYATQQKRLVDAATDLVREKNAPKSDKAE